MGWGGRTLLRLCVVIVTMASVLVPAWIAPAKTLRVPSTMVRTLRFDPAGHQPRRVVFDFAPTHVAFSWSGGESTGIRYRTTDGHVKSRWTIAPEAHDAERGDRHFSGVIAVARPSALEWLPLRRGAGMGRVTIDYLNTLDGPRREVDVPAVAMATPQTPRIITRAEWGADESIKRTRGTCERRFFPVQQLFVHHTAGANFDTRPAATMRAIYWYHTVRQGWCDVGYNFVIAPDGRIFEGRWARNYGPWEVHDSENRAGYAVAGAHVANYNSGSVGVSLMGNYSTVQLPPSARRSLAELLAWEADRHDLRPRGWHTYRNPETGLRRWLPYIAGHRDAGYTSCPGDRVYSSLRAIRRDVETVMGAGKADSEVTLAAGADRVLYGEAASFTGALVDQAGVGLAGRPIRTYVRKGTTWQEGPRAVTNRDGTFSFTMTAYRNVVVTAVYDGDAATWGDESALVRVRVRPEVSLSDDGTVDSAGVSHHGPAKDRVTFSGRVRPRHSGHRVVVFIAELQPDGTYQRVGKKEVVLDSYSRYRTTWRVSDPATGGSFRAVTRFPPDSDHTGAKSPPLFFVVDPSPA